MKNHLENNNAKQISYNHLVNDTNCEIRINPNPYKYDDAQIALLFSLLFPDE